MANKLSTQIRRSGRRGWAFISYSREDKERIQPIIDYLKSRDIEIWWDDLLQPGDRWGDVIKQKVWFAACVIVIWSRSSVHNMFVESEVRSILDKAKELGHLVPVLLDKEALKEIPLPFNVFQCHNLSTWNGRSHRPLQKFGTIVRKLVNRPRHSGDDWPMLDESQISWARKTNKEMRDLGRRVGKVGEVMISDVEAVDDLRATLNEVHKTLDVVAESIEEFIAAGIKRTGLDARPYVRFERGVLSRRIRDGKGQCDLIALHYGRPDGIREWLIGNAGKRVLTAADKAFKRLSLADGDLFEDLARVGDALTNEARAIVNLLLADQTNAARDRIRDGRELLQPLEDDLHESIKVFQEIEQSLGFAPSS